MMVDASSQPEIPTWYGPGSAELSTGTTLVAFEFADGVVMAADSRTSTGSFVSVRVTDKLKVLQSPLILRLAGKNKGVFRFPKFMIKCKRFGC